MSKKRETQMFITGKVTLSRKKEIQNFETLALLIPPDQCFRGLLAFWHLLRILGTQISSQELPTCQTIALPSVSLDKTLFARNLVSRGAACPPLMIGKKRKKKKLTLIVAFISATVSSSVGN